MSENNGLPFWAVIIIMGLSVIVVGWFLERPIQERPDCSEYREAFLKGFELRGQTGWPVEMRKALEGKTVRYFIYDDKTGAFWGETDGKGWYYENKTGNSRSSREPGRF